MTFEFKKLMKKERKIAVITGASQGIGATISIGLAREGYQVVLIARSKQNLEKVSHEIITICGNVSKPFLVPLDLTDYEAVDKTIREIHHTFGRIDVLVNAAGMFMDGSLDESVDNYKKIIDINLVAQYAVLKTAAEMMKSQGFGYIFNIASRAGKYGFPGGGIYGSTKYAFVGLTDSLYRELSPLGIRIISLCPGWVNTEMAVTAGTPLKADEMIQPEDILKTILFLLSLSKSVCIKDIVFDMQKSIV